MKLITQLLVLFGFVLPNGYEEDKAKLVNIYRELLKVEETLKKGQINSKVIDKLNALGYPIYQIYSKYKYTKERSEIDLKLYAYSKKLYKHYFFVKRSIFPKFVMMDAKRNKLPVCNVEVKGKEKKHLIVRIQHPENDEEIREVYEGTQLFFADRLGFESIDFRRCKE
ncbi:hypothetical protein [Aquifex aeolicus]|uniref:Uncharacterized protein aq_1187 n=1 Tax=Aquifex aeolicus (strain VF5) TaxID=224324 RepID=Y1187_AQUAE|nr:hypothetical protein [Aquifex aeolicus]O67247.1 RecName: Full=Uncharacterized protein aq_1187 [Aquifex aeolicus VF5]AAC07219.1 putative protein [Aquifex aeolicus VF5]